MPGAARRAARAFSAVIGFSNSILTDSLWPMNTGTRTQVAVTWMSGSRIFCVSTTIFHSSLVKPESRKTSICGMTLKAICLVNLLDLDRIGDEHGAGLAEQLVHRLLAGAGHRLIGGNHHPLDLGQVVQRLERHHQLGGRAIGIGDDAFRESRSSASALTSGTTSGTCRSMRQALELSITRRPARRSWAPIPWRWRRRRSSARCRCP